MFAVALATVLGGCTSTTGPGGELDVARQRWAERGPSDYRITIQRSCECTPEMSGPVIVEVVDGAVTARAYAASGAAVAAEYAELFPAVPGLFAIVDEARRERAPRMEVTYDPELGYPSRISVDWNATTVDDEVTYLATDLQPMP